MLKKYDVSTKILENCKRLKILFEVDKKGFEKEYVLRHKFKTKNSSDIKYKLLVIAEDNIDRKSGRNIIQKYVKYEHIAYEIEKGLFEFSLVHVTINGENDHFVCEVYADQLNNICENLDMTNKHVENKSLLPTVLSTSFTPYYVAFLSPDQLHPERWKDVSLKKQIRDEAMNSFQTTDIYKCKKCHERKFKITEIQLRSSDEPMNRVCTCMTCFFTFII